MSSSLLSSSEGFLSSMHQRGAEQAVESKSQSVTPNGTKFILTCIAQYQTSRQTQQLDHALSTPLCFFTGFRNNKRRKENCNLIPPVARCIIFGYIDFKLIKFGRVGLRRHIQVVVSREAWVQIPEIAIFFNFSTVFFNCFFFLLRRKKLID